MLVKMTGEYLNVMQTYSHCWVKTQSRSEEVWGCHWEGRCGKMVRNTGSHMIKDFLYVGAVGVIRWLKGLLLAEDLVQSLVPTV